MKKKDEFISYLMNKLEKLIPHDFVKKEQSKHGLFSRHSSHRAVKTKFYSYARRFDDLFHLFQGFYENIANEYKIVHKKK